ncbi:MAG: SDR family NAD(P)-dependent oxidoreductase, partial [Oscillochloris sp.]|nr:SDR family NAD(P)-dependent oxidoreductase [Oscillochloris sp.]
VLFRSGDTNAHVVLEEAPELVPGDLGRDQHMLVLSAKTATALEQAAANLAAHLRAHPEQPLADVAYTLQIGRQQFAHRLALVCHDATTAAAALETLDPRQVLVGEAEDVRSLAFLFTGQGAQYVGMARELYAGEPLFREQVDYCAELLRPHLGLDLRELIFDSVRPETLNETRYTQPALFVIEYATAQLLISWGLQPQAMIGHSIGEYVAACLAGVFSLEDALALVAARGRLMQQMPAGTMLSVQLDEAELRRRLLPGVELAAINAPELCVVAGPDEAITAFESRLSADGIGCRRLHTSHAFHTAMMDPVIAPFAALVDRLTLNPPTIPFLSNLSGNWITADEATDPHYWARHLRQGVRFADGLSALFAGQPMALIEVGPGQTLATFARQHPQSRGHAILATLPGPRDPARADAMMLGALGRLWLLGAPVDWVAFSAGERRLRVPLPTYPFERERYWLNPLLFDATPRRGVLRKRPDITDWFYTPSWRRVSLAIDRAVLAPGASERWLVLSECNIGSGLADGLATEGAEVLTICLGDRFAQLEPGMFSLNPLCRADYDLLLDAMGTNLPSHILYTWSLSEQSSAGRRDLLALTYLVQALASRAAKPTRIVVLTAGAHEVVGTEELNPHVAMLAGLSRVIGQEFSQLSCRCIDLNPGELLNEQLLGQLRVDLRADVGIASVAYRAGQRWVESFEPTRLAPLDLPALPRTGGVYLITGGLGRVGLVLAATLARAGVGALVLTGRTALPDRSDWAQWLTLYGEHDRVSRSIRGVQALEALGVQVLSAQADAASYEQMAAVLSKALQHFGAVHGLIHAAGLVGTASLRMLNELNEAQCEALLHAKVEGALVLARLAQEYQPDFVLLISSLAAVAGGMGMGTYAAANRFLDTLARKQSQSGDIPWISIGWDGWNFGDLPMGGAGASLAMTPAEGGEAFWRALGWQVGPQLLVSTGDLLVRLEPPAPVAAESLTVLHARPRLRTGYVAPSGEVELTIAALWEQVLGIEQIGIYDDFFELGGHSLLATQMISRL